MFNVTPPSDAILLAMIASFTTLAAQVVGLIFGIRERKQATERREELAKKVEQHSNVIAQKLDVNTELTLAASENATQAYVEANNFNQRLGTLEQQFATSISEELIRLSNNIHSIANALQPVVGAIKLEDRPQERGKR